MVLTSGQGYSTPSGYRLPSGETIKATEENRRAIIRSGRSGRGRNRREIEAEVQAERNRQEEIKKQEAEKVLMEAIEKGRIKAQSQTITGQLQSKQQINNLNQGKIQFAKGTVQDNIPRRDIKVYTEPTYIERQTGTFKDTTTGKEIPITEVVYFDPFGESIGKASMSTERKATQEEVKQFREQTNVLQASTDKRTQFDVAKSKGRSLVQRYNQINYDLSQSLEGYGLTDENIKKGSDVLSYGSPLGLIKGGREKLSEFTYGAIKSVKDKPLTNVVLFGTGKAVGFGVKASKEIVLATKVGSKVSKLKPVAYGSKAVSLGLGTAIVGVEGTRIIKSDKPFEELGKTAVEGTAFGLGYIKSGSSLKKKYYSSYKEPELTLGKDIIQPISSEGRVIELGKFDLTARVPKQVVYSDRPIKKAFRNLGINNRFTGLKLEKETKEYFIDSSGQIITEQGNIIYGQTVSGRRGKTLKNVDIISGGSQETVDPKSLILKKQRLTSIQDYQLNKLTGGVFEEKAIYSVGELETTKAFRISGKGKKRTILIPNEGKRRSIYSTASRITPTVQREGISQDYISQMNLLDISKPRTRVRKAKLDNIYGETKVLEPIEYSSMESNIVKRSSTKPQVSKDLLQLSNQQAIQRTTQVKAKIVSDIKKRAYGNFKNQININQNQYPTYVGGTGGLKSEYYGKGSYELSEVYGQIPKQKDLVISGFSTRNLMKTNLINLPRESSKNLNRNLNKNQSRNILREIQSPVQKSVQKQIQKQSQKTLQKQVLKQTRTGQRGLRPLKPFRLPPIIPKPKSIKLRGDSKRKSQIFGQPTKYQASLTSSILNIRSKRKPMFGGGLQIRPILS